MLIAILIPVHNHLPLTQLMLKDLSVNLKGTDAFECVVIDDGSTDGTSKYISENYLDVHLLKGNGDLWWSGAINMGTKFAIDILKADYVLLWNNDIQFGSDYFKNVLRVLKDFPVDTIIGSSIYVAEKTGVTWSKGGYFNPVSGKYGMYGYFKKDIQTVDEIKEVDWLTGMGSIIPCKIVEELKYWDHHNFPQYFGDSEFTYRAKLKGYKIIVHPRLKIYNKVEFSGLQHSGSFRMLIKLMTDNRSKINFKRNLKFYRMYATSYKAYLRFFLKYCFILGGFIKWKILSLLSIKKKPVY